MNYRKETVCIALNKLMIFRVEKVEFTIRSEPQFIYNINMGCIYMIRRPLVLNCEYLAAPYGH